MPSTKKQRKRAIRSAGAATLAVVAGVLVACGSDDSDSGDSGSSEEAVDIALVDAQRGVSFVTSMECGAQDAADELGNVELSIQGPPEFELAQQQPILQAAEQKSPDGMVLVPTDPKALIQDVEGLMEKDIPVVTVDGNLDQPVEVQNIRTDNVEAGKLAAQEMAKSIGESGTVLTIGLDPGVPANQERIDSFVEELEANYPDIKLLETLYPGTDQNKSATQTAGAIRANPDLKGVYVSHLAAGVGASTAILNADKRGEIKLISYDADPQQVRDLKDGVYDALVVQKPYQLGYDGVKLAVQAARDEVDVESLEDTVLIPPVIATQDNIDDPEVNKFLYTTSC